MEEGKSRKASWMVWLLRCACIEGIDQGDSKGRKTYQRAGQTAQGREQRAQSVLRSGLFHVCLRAALCTLKDPGLGSLTGDGGGKGPDGRRGTAGSREGP